MTNRIREWWKMRKTDKGRWWVGNIFMTIWMICLIIIMLLFMAIVVENTEVSVDYDYENLPGEFFPPPELVVENESWRPENFSDLWDHNFNFEDESIHIWIEDYDYPQNIILDVRSTRHFSDNFITDYEAFIIVEDAEARLLRTEIRGCTLRQIWLISGLDPDRFYEFDFYGQGVCGRCTEE